MKFPGYRLSIVDGALSVCVTEFDETELSTASDWKETWENADEALPHGYVEPFAMLHAVCRRVLEGTDPELAASFTARFQAGEALPVSTLEDLARLMQMTLPKKQ